MDNKTVGYNRQIITLAEDKMNITYVDWLSTHRTSKPSHNAQLRVSRNYASHIGYVSILLKRHLSNQIHDQELEIMVPIPQISHLISLLQQSVEEPEMWERHHPSLRKPDAPKVIKDN